MRTCVYRQIQWSGIHCNHPSIDIDVSSASCEVCRIGSQTTFFTATESLWAVKQSSGEYKPKPKPCGGCGGASKKKPANKAAIVPESRQFPEREGLQFVWCYWHGGAKSDELRWSMRSVEANYQGACKFLVIGDRPPWYDGPVIEQQRQKHGKGFERGLRDVLLKMHTISRHPDVDAEFVWMMDDVFLIRPTGKQDLQVARYSSDIGEPDKNRWQKIKAATAKRLRRNGLQALDYATHLPHFVQKQKLAKLFETWDPLKHVFLWEVAYQNTFSKNTAPHRPFLSRIKKQYNQEWYNRTANRSTFLNVQGSAWGNDLRNWMVDRFRKPHTDEIGMRPRTVNLIEPRQPEDHICLIQSAYDDGSVSEYRLRIAEQTVIPSLRSQTRKVKVQVSLCEYDPLQEERRRMWLSCGHEVGFVYRESAVTESDLYSDPWYLPEGRNLIQRCDDDDILPVDFFELTHLTASHIKYETALLTWPNGYVWHAGKLHRLSHRYNQFCSIVSNDHRLHPHRYGHRQFEGAIPSVAVEHSRGWVWVRHDVTISDTKPRYLRQDGGQPNLKRWPVDITALGELYADTTQKSH